MIGAGLRAGTSFPAASPVGSNVVSSFARPGYAATLIVFAEVALPDFLTRCLNGTER